MKLRNVIRRTAPAAAIACLAAGFACSSRPAWETTSERLIKDQNIPRRTRADIPKGKASSNLEPGIVTSIDRIAPVESSPGVTEKIYWSRGIQMRWMTLTPGAEIPRRTLAGERIAVVMKGSVEALLGGAWMPLAALARATPDGAHGGTPRNDFVRLEPGTEFSVKAGPSGAELLAVDSPPDPAALKTLGLAKTPAALPAVTFALAPSVEAGRVGDVHDLQFTTLSPGALSRLIWGRSVQLSFIRMDPGSAFPLHVHPEEQLMTSLRGGMDELILDGRAPMAAGDLLYLPGDLVHGGANGPRGTDALDVFWPARPDYAEKAAAALAAYRAIVPEDARVELVLDGKANAPGLVFTEGPAWLGGKLYFSSMGFDAAWNGAPAKSMLVEMSADGAWRAVSRGRMLTNGMKPLPNGNLAVCDMFGHRVVEMTTGGRVVRVLADRYEGKPLDGPNDIVFDARGGMYFSDPQFTAEPVKSQPGKCVYYRRADGRLVRVIEPGTYGMPNGLVLSPDGKTLYVANTFDDAARDTDKDNFVWAYDVREDGTLAGERKFAELMLTPEILEAGEKSTSADGMTIDERGDLFVCTYLGVQVFAPEGRFLGVINLPTFPVNACFGGEDGKTLYVVSYDRVYRVRTNVRGLDFAAAAAGRDAR